MSYAYNYTVLPILLFGLLIYGCGGGGGGGEDSGDGGGSEGFTLQGIIKGASGNAVDGDVNDPNAPYTANDTLATAQFIPNPVIVGGYVNLPGTGPGGRSQRIGDFADYYRIDLIARQSITLFIAGDGLADDLDLALFDADGNLVDEALGTGKFELLTVVEAGSYTIRVSAYRGATNYILTIGQETGLTAVGPRLSDDFVPGEAIVRFADRRAATATGAPTRAQALGLQVKGGADGRNLLLSLDSANGAVILQALGVGPAAAVAPVDSVLQRKRETLWLLKALRQRADVLYAEPNYWRQPQFTPGDELYPLQWHYPQINLPAAWDIATGANTLVAVVDTGIVDNHLDLQGQLVSGYDFVSDPANAGDGNGIDPDPSDPGDAFQSFHGTHVAGTVAAATNNTIGGAGVAFGAKIMPLRALGLFGGTDHDIEQAVRYAAGLDNDSGTKPARRADVINLSLGGPGTSATGPEVFRQAREAGVVIVAAAGNYNSSEPLYPAAYPGVISVAAVDIDKTRAPYSNFGPTVDVAAPGGNTARDLDGDGRPDGVLSTAAALVGGFPFPDYQFYQGTSMATPHVAGVVVLMRAVNPALTPADIDNLLAGGGITTDLGTPGRDDQYGYGLINAYLAVVAAGNAPGGTPVTPTPVLAINPPALNFGLSLDILTVTVTNGGVGSLTVSYSENSGGWLGITPPADPTGLGNYTVTVNRASLADGVYSAVITFTSTTAGSMQVPVILQIDNDLSPSDVGQLYVLLIDPVSFSAVQYVLAERQDVGTYHFQFSEVPAGVYEIFTGSDFDNDGYLCTSGEVCGAYLTLDEPVDIAVNGDRGDLDFGATLSAGLQDAQSTGASAGSSGEGLRRGRDIKQVAPR